MVRETRHLWVGNLPENIREEKVRDHFKRYGRVQSVKLVPGGAGAQCAAVAFMDIKSAAKAHNAEHTLDDQLLSTEYYEPVTPLNPTTPPVPPPSRFPLGAGAEEHPAFDRTSHLYERGSSTPGSPLSVGGRSDVEYLRRPAVYHAPPEPLRGRPRERVYRNGPTYPAATERSNTGNQRRSWQLDLSSCPRFPADSGESVTNLGSAVKRKQSGSESRSGSQSSRSRSPARSPTHSSSPSTRSSRSSERSASPGDGKARLAVQSTVTPPSSAVSAGAAASAAATLSVYSDDRRPLAICVRDLPTRSSDTSLKDGLFHEYKKHGKVTWVKVVGCSNDRYALVCFKKPEDVEKAIEVSQDKKFFGRKIDVAPYHGYDVEDNEARPYDTELDEYHPKATRTLFIGNLEKDITAQDIRQAFEQFGEIIEIDVKKQSGVALSYAFCQYADISSVVQAMRTLDGELLGESRLKLGFGKSMASSCVWVAGVADQVSEKYLDLQFHKFGPLSQVVVDRVRGQALLFFDQVPDAAAAVKEMRGVTLRGRRIQIDFASRECQEAFFERIEAQRESWAATDESGVPRLEAARARYDAPRVRSSSYSRSSGGRTPRRHDVFSESPRYRSFEDLSPGSDYDDLQPGEQTDLNHLHKRRDQIQKLLRLDTREKEKSRPTRSVMAADQGLVVTTHNHRRRLSSHRRSSGEGPAPLCKRRKTGSTSEDERRRHHHHSGDESRPGTPLIDELPDQRPKEPRKGPLKRPDEPLSLPLPEFAAHCFPNVRMATVSVPLSPPRSASPPVVAPASPARPPSPLSNSSSEISPQSPTLEERIRSLDEKYEQWSGRTQPVITKPRHHLLEVDVRELQPSDIVKSVLSRPSVFDEDSKRLENVNEKYEPRDFSTYQRPPGLEVQTPKLAPGDPRSACFMPVSVRVSPHGSPSTTVLSPAAKGLQYPFPSHPPMLSTSGATATTSSLSPPCTPVRAMSKSMEFSVQKAESWLGINRSDSNSSGFSTRFLVSGLRHKPDAVAQITSKSDGKSLDPRLDKSPVAPVTPVTPATPAVTSAPPTSLLVPLRGVTRLCDGEWSKLERVPVSGTKPADNVDTVKPSVPIGKVHRPEPLPSRRSEVSELKQEIVSDRNLGVSKPESLRADNEPVSRLALPLTEPSVESVLDKETAKLSRAADTCSVSVSVSDTTKQESVLHQSESTKTLDTSVKKPNSPESKSDDSPTASAVKCVVVSKPDNGIVAHAQVRELVPPKAVSENVPFNIRDKESGSLNPDRPKTCLKERDRCRDDKDKSLHSMRDSDKDRQKDRSINEKDRERNKSVSRDKTKDREISETVDKERKKDRDVEIDRKRDRESIEIVERERRKGNCDVKDEELEIDGKKDHNGPLDRRKWSGDKRSDERKSCDQSDKQRKRDCDKERRKDNIHEKEKKKEHSSEKQRKSSDEKKREDDSDKTREKHRDKHSGLSSGSAPVSIGSKRRISSADSLEGEEAKRARIDQKRRDSRDSRSSGSSKRSETKDIKHSQHSNSSTQSKPVENCEPKPADHKRKEEGERKKHCSEPVDKSRPKDPTKRIKLKNEKDEIRPVRDYNGKTVKDNQDKPKEQSSDTDDDKRHSSNKKEKKRSFDSFESLEEKRIVKRERTACNDRKKEGETHEERSQKENSKLDVRRENGITESCTDSDSEPKKHSIFDVVLDEPAYISMYDKVKARSTKNLQKLEEEKRQVKLKEKFSALKQSRAKREEKKRSTSWDDDSDSDASQRRSRPRARRVSRLSSDEPRDFRPDCSSSEDAVRERPRTGRLRAAEIYTDDDSDSMEKTRPFSREKASDVEVEKKPIITSADANTPKDKSEKSSHDNNKINKMRLSFDSSTDRFTNELKNKKHGSTEALSETETKYPSFIKNNEKSDRKKSKKKEKRSKWSDEEKIVNVEQHDNKSNDRLDRKKLDKKERRKSIQIGSDISDENTQKKKSPVPKLSAQAEVLPCRDREDKKLEEIFGSCDDSDQSQQKADGNGKWHVDEIYNSEESTESISEARKTKEKKKKDRKSRESVKEGNQLDQDFETRLPYTHDSEETMATGMEMKTKTNKEKKKKRKKSKEEKSNRHHHHHYHHDRESRDHHNREQREVREYHDREPRETRDHLEKVVKAQEPATQEPVNQTNLAVARPRTPSPSLPMPVLAKPARKDKLPLFGCDNQEKQHETAVQSISQPETPKTAKLVVTPLLEEKDNAKERTVISQEETEVAVASLLGETFTFGSCYSGSPPAEPEPAPHDEEEMRQAVQSLNSDLKPPTPQSDTDLQIDTDAEEAEEFSGGRFDFIPRTPDVELGPPKTPDISPAFLNQNKPFVRKDTTRNSRDDMDMPIVDGPLNVFSSPEGERKPPILKPPSPKLTFSDEPPAIEPQIKRLPDKVFVDSRENRLLLAPPPLVPVSKQVPPSPPRPTSNIAIVRPISLANSPTLVLTPIRTTTTAAPVHSTPLPRKTYTLSPPGGLITTRMSISPPVLSPVTPGAVTTPKLLSPQLSQAPPVPRVSGPTSIVTSRPITTQLVAQKLIVSPPIAPQPVSTPIRPVIAPEVTRTQHIPFSSPETGVVPAMQQQRARPSVQSSTQPHVISSTPVITHTRPSTMQSSAITVIKTSAPMLAPTSPSVTVQSLVPLKPLVTTVTVPTLQVAQKTTTPAPLVSSVTDEVTTLTSATNVAVSVICQKPATAKSPIDIKVKVENPDVKAIEQPVLLSVDDVKENLQEVKDIKIERIDNEVDDYKPDIKHTQDDTVKEEVEETIKAEVPTLKIPTKSEGPLENHVGESVIKRVEPQEKSDTSVDQSAETQGSNLTNDSKDESSDDDKPINAIVKKGRKKVARGGAAVRRGQRATGKVDTSLATTDNSVTAAPPPRRSGRGRGARSGQDGGRKLAADVYEFHDESDEEGDEDQDRPRLVITIKNSNNANQNPPAQTPGKATSVSPKPAALSPKEALPKQAKSPPASAAVKVKDVIPEPQKSVPTLPTSNNTRKSRRLLEKDGSRNTVDEVIEDVIRSVNQRTSPRRSMRQVTVAKPVTMAPPPPKKNRGKKTTTDDDVKSIESPKTPDIEEHSNEAKDLPMVNRPAEETSEASDEEPTTLIDPVTGMLMVMRAKEGGKYVPVPNASTQVPPASPSTITHTASPLTPPPPAPSIDLPPKSISALSPNPKIEAQSQPFISEGLASHWLSQAQTTKGTLKAPEKSAPQFMGCRPPTPPTTPLTVQVSSTPVFVSNSPLIVQGSGVTPLPSPGAPVTHVIQPDPLLRPTSKPLERPKSVEPTHIKPVEPRLAEGPKLRVEQPFMIHKDGYEFMPTKPSVATAPTVKAPPYANPRGSLTGSPGAKIPLNELLPPKPLYPNMRCIQPGAKGMMSVTELMGGKQIYSTPRALAPGASIECGPSPHELLPMTGAVASPPLRPPHFASQQPVVAGSSSARALGESAHGSRASPRPLALVPPLGPMGEVTNPGHLSPFVHHQFAYQQYLPGLLGAKYRAGLEERGSAKPGQSPPMEARRSTDPVYGRYFDDQLPPHLHPRAGPPTGSVHPQLAQPAEAPSQPHPRMQVATPPHASIVPFKDSLYTRLLDFPLMWQGLLTLKTDQSAVQMHFILGNKNVARECLRSNADGSTSPLHIAQRMRLEHKQLEGVARKMQIENEHCMLLALPCGRDPVDVIQQSNNLRNAFITYLQQKQAAGIVNVFSPHSLETAYIVHIFPACDFANAALARVAPDLQSCVQDFPHLIIVIATI